MAEIWFEREGTRLFAVEAGEGRAIVMLHGGMSSHLSSLPFIVPLIPRYRVVAPDLRGSGRSWYGGRLSFDQLADDVEALLDHLKTERAVIGGASGGTGVALRFALRHPARAAGLVLVQPVYGGEEWGYTDAQKAAFAAMDSVASRALAEGVQVLRPLYENLPPGIREKALAMIEEFDAAIARSRRRRSLTSRRRSGIFALEWHKTVRYLQPFLGVVTACSEDASPTLG